MINNRIHLALAFVLAFTVTSTRAQASNVISADFVYSDLVGVGPVTGDTTVSSGPTWNSDGLIFTGQNVIWNAVTVGTNNGNNNFASTGFLHDGDGNATTVQFTMGAADGSGGDWRDNFTTTTTPLLRSLSSDPSQTAEEAYLYNGVLTGDHYNWEITGLHPNGVYNLAFFGDNSLPLGTTHTANGVAGTLDSQGDWNWSKISANGSGNILGIFTDPTPTSGLFGFQIQAATPEPSTLILAGCGILGMLPLLRRKNRRA